MLEDGDFGRYWNSLKRDVVKYGSCVAQEFSFDNRIIKTTFNFVFVVLDLLGRTSAGFQKRFCTVDELWYIVVSLKKAFVSFIERERMTTESGFDCFASLNANEKTELKNVLREIASCIELRFYSPSSSVHMKGLSSRKFQSTTQQNCTPLQQRSVLFLKLLICCISHTTSRLSIHSLAFIRLSL